MMKRILLLFLVCTLLCACSSGTKSIKEPISFYYPKAQLTYGQQQSVILSEIRDAVDFDSSITAILNSYLSGPESQELNAIFPKDTYLVSFRMNDAAAVVVLSHHFAKLEGVALTVACTCLTRTVMELTATRAVTIRVANEDGEGVNHIVTMDKNSYQLLDESAS